MKRPFKVLYSTLLKYVLPILFFSIFVSANTPVQATPPTYLVSDLGIGSAQGINSTGQVVGYIYTDTSYSQYYAFSWDSTHGLQNLGTLGGSNSAASAINNNGQVTGNSNVASGDVHGFVYSGGTMTDIGNLPGGSRSVHPQAINTASQIVGEIGDTSGSLPFTWTSATGVQNVDYYGSPSGNDVAFGINDAGVFVGRVVFNQSPHAFRHAGSGRVVISDDMGSLGGSSSGADGINSAGQIVGYSYLSGDSSFHAFRHSGTGSLTAADDLGTLGGASSDASAINTAGQVVGEAQIADGTFHAFLWTPNGSKGTMVDLNTLIPACFGIVLTSANSINDKGQVACIAEQGVTANYSGTPHAILLTPLSLLTIKDLGTLGGNNSSAYGINVRSQVVGQADTSSSTQHAFLWDGTAGMKDLGVLPGGSESTASGISATGQVSGSSYTPIQGPHGFLWKPGGTSGTMSDLGTLGASGNAGDFSMANAINNEGILCGVSENSSQNYHMLKYDSNTMTAYDLDQYRDSTLRGGSYSAAYALDTVNGYIFGEADNALGATLATAFTANSSQLFQIDSDAYILPGGSFSRMLAASNYNSYAGEADTSSGETHAFRFLVNPSPAPNTISDIGTLPSSFYHYSSAAGINDLGLVVGTSYTDTGYHAFFSDGTAMTDLNAWLPSSSSWVLQKATSLSGPGQIVGYGTINKKVHAFILGPP